MYNRFLVQMGLLIQTSFETQQGFAVSSVYCRINGVTFDPLGGGEYTITMKPQTYISRERRLDGKSPISTPGLPEHLSIRGTFGDMSYVYALLKTHLEDQGLTVEDVIEASQQSSESTPTTPPTPPPPSESQESSPEPQQPPSSEYAPAPAETEA